jgi:hypothetical protein
MVYLKEKDSSEVLIVDGRTIKGQKCERIGSVWLRLWTSDCSCEHDNKPPAFVTDYRLDELPKKIFAPWNW